MRKTLTILKPDESDSNILVSAYNCDFVDELGREYEQLGLDHFIDEFRKLAVYCMSNGAKNFEVGIFTDIDLIKTTTNGYTILATEDENSYHWVEE